MSPQSMNSTRKDVLRLVLREMLTRNGIPQTWIAADMLRTTSSKRLEGLHVRFLVRHWQPRLSKSSKFVIIEDGDHGLTAHVDLIAREITGVSR